MTLTCALQGELTCSPHIARISEMRSIKGDATRPQVLVSGEIHGDERVVSYTK
jgi:hypothetical protein